MSRKRIAIACQGGGSQCAFVAGALKTLLKRRIHDQYQVVGLSGTSGGALTAALAWAGLIKEAHGDKSPIEAPIVAFWETLSAQTPQEMIFDQMSVQLLRLVEDGFMPSIANSPSSPRFVAGSKAAAKMLGRPEFTDLRAALVKHLDVDAVRSLVAPDSPVLLVGAADILEGNFKVFSSARGEISVDSLLASAAIPNLFPAVEVDGHYYWDGIFSSNPPVVGFLQAIYRAETPLPQEIWILQVNPSKYRDIPTRPSDILDRRNHLSGNLSLRHELQLIEMVNVLLQEDALTESFRTRFKIDLTEPITVRFIRMSPELLDTLDYPSKLSRQPVHIARLMADGETQAQAFLEALREGELPSEPTVEGTSAELH